MVQELLLSEASDCREVVCQLEKTLHHDKATLKEPDVQTKVLVRCLARRAKSLERLDVVKHLRGIVPAGTTGEFITDVGRAQFVNHPAEI